MNYPLFVLSMPIVGLNVSLLEISNTDLDSTCSITNIINAFIVEHNLYRCEKLFNVGQKCTYVNEHLNHASTVDYCLCSDSSAVLAFNVLDPDVLNLSDH